jgi:3-deoxy-D-manno-octulosonate 8-phosphate phosphatase (KDO 8-P phosphatase)
MSDIDLASLASPEVMARARKIKLFLMDVDGTPTDGGVCLISTTAANGSTDPIVSEMKVFNAQDGQGLWLAHTMGIQTGFITARSSPAVAKRADELKKVTYVYLGQAKKTAAFEECMQKAGVTKEEVAYMGEDLPDIPLARRAGPGSGGGGWRARVEAVCHFNALVKLASYFSTVGSLHLREDGVGASWRAKIARSPIRNNRKSNSSQPNKSDFVAAATSGCRIKLSPTKNVLTPKAASLTIST